MRIKKERGKSNRHDAYNKLLEEINRSGCRLTQQRLAIIDEVFRSQKHIKINDFYFRIRKKYPGIGLTTVYHTLELLEKLGRLRKISGVGKYAVYDTNVIPHINYVCPVCGSVEDGKLSKDIMLNLTRRALKLGRHNPEIEITIRAPCKAHAVR
jgi:Fe2+ or Zn2+ uptake regulation protein